MDHSDKPFVSISCITYNHENFISDAIDGFLMQKTSFSYEIVIGEDCSTDGTRAILLHYKERYPGKFRLLLHDKNKGMMDNFTQTIKACSGKYIALCEGDDYWTDPLKLQKQVEFMETQPECSMCFHRAYQYDQQSGDKTLIPLGCNPRNRDIFNITKFIRGNLHIPTASMLFRNGLSPYSHSLCKNAPMGDWPLTLAIAEKGDLGLINQPMSIYRVHSGGVWSKESRDKNNAKMEYVFELMHSYYGKQFLRQINAGESKFYISRALKSADEGDISSARYYLRKGIILCPIDYDRPIIERLYLIVSIHFPVIYNAMLKIIKAGNFRGK